MTNQLPEQSQAEQMRYLAASNEYTQQQRNKGTAYLIWLFFGFFGGHKFYMGKTGMGLAYLFTLGFLTVGAWIDMFTMGSQIRKRNLEIERDVFARHGLVPPNQQGALQAPPQPAA